MLISCHFQILLAISEIKLTLPYVSYLLYVKSAVSLKWQVGFENDENNTYFHQFCLKILIAISEVQLTLPYVLYVLYVKSVVPLKWQVGFENDMKLTPVFTIIINSKMLIKSALHYWNILF